MAPIVRPSTATNTLNAERHDARRKARMAHCSGFDRAVDQLHGTRRARSAIDDHPSSPDPIVSRTCEGIESLSPFATAASTMVAATT